MSLLFKRGPLIGIRLVFFTILSIALMALDERSSYFQQIENQASVIAVPLQYLVNWPIEFFDWLGDSVASQQQVLEENARLRAEQLLLQAKLQRVVALENENAQLRALLQSSPHVGGKFSVAQLLAVSMDPAIQKVVLDRGERELIYVGQPVLDAYGVMGQVVEVGPFTSQVLLVTDVQSAIPVQDSRNGIRAIAQGSGNGLMELVNVPDSTDIQQGDMLVTSGLGERFPAGYPVGVVKKVTRDPEFRFASVIIVPSAHIDRSRQVLLVWPNFAVRGQQSLQTQQPPQSVEPPFTNTANTKPSEIAKPSVPVVNTPSRTENVRME